MESCNEGKAADFFMKYIKIKKDKNSEFVSSVSETSEKIIYTLQELQMKV